MQVFAGFTSLTPDETLKKLGSVKTGLSHEEVLKRQNQFGRNEISSQKNTWFTILSRQFHSSFLYLLLGAAVVSFFLGEKLDSFLILLFVAINTLLGFFQEYRSEKALQLLKQFVKATARVIRDGKEQSINNSALVVGDIILVEPGDIIPADIRFVEGEFITVDESILTGESIASDKTIENDQQPVNEPFKAKNIGFSGTTVIAGEGVGVVIAIAKDTVIGSIARITSETVHTSSFEKELQKLSTFVLKLISVTLVGMVVINILLKGTSINIPSLLVFAIALAISVVPEALPAVITFSFSRGALRLAKHKVIVKRLSAIEDLGSVQVLCTDKTGTITENKLTLHSMFPQDAQAHAFAAMAVPQKTPVVDSFDIALLKGLTDKDHEIHKSYTFVEMIPFDPKRRRVTMVYKKKNDYLLVSRGAPEIIVDLCTKETVKQKKEIFDWIETEGKQGRRILAVATKQISSTHDIKKQEDNLEFVGLVSFVDALKSSTIESVKTAESLGVAIKILTGDAKEVAGAIAHQVGLIKDPSNVMTGEEFEHLDIDGQHAAVDSHCVFARVSPEQKYHIIKLLKEKYEVGFLGEGINDAPALKEANVAIVVEHASDIAKETADIILLNKSLTVIIDGIKEGREIFANTAKYIKATLASNFGNFYTVAIASFFIPFLPLLPLQILLINLLTDFPMIAVATDTVDADELKSPKNYQIQEIALFATIMGIVSSLFDFLFFVLFYQISPSVLQTNWFIGSVLTELVFLFSIRTKLFAFKSTRPSSILVLLSVAAFCTALLLPFTQLGHVLFKFISPSQNHLLLIVLLTVSYFTATEIVKYFYYHLLNGNLLKKKNT